MNRVDGKVAIVTGAGGGLGGATSELLATAGAKVVAADVDLSAAEKTVANIVAAGGQAVAVQQDVSSESDWQRVVDTTLENFGQLNVLVNNAGMGMSGQCKNMSLEDWRRILGVNLDGAFLGIRSAIKVMADNNFSGSIINISSASGLVGGGPVPYSTAKGGMTMLTKSVANECGRLGYKIRVNTVYPGVINTSMWITPRNEEEAKAIPSEAEKNRLREATFQHIPLGRAAEPIEIAKGVLFLASDDSSYMTGASLVIDGGYTAVGGQTLPDDLLE